MNVALYVPVALFASLLIRRPFSVAVCLVLLSAATETIQAVTPGIGRSCDSSDLLTNSLGAVAGCGAAYLWTRRKTANGGLPSRRELMLGGITLAAGLALVSAVVASATTVVPADVAESTAAGPDQRAAANRAYGEFFGPSVRATSVQFLGGSHSRPGTVNVTGGAGSLTLSWPSGEASSGLVGPLPEQAPGDLSDSAAVAVAGEFAKSHFPWALVGSYTRVDAQPNAGGAKIVQWRSRVDGVLMPMRLDVFVTGSGRVSSFSARHVEPPALPRATVPEEAARAVARTSHPGFDVTTAELLAQSDERGEWHVRWLVGMTRPTPQPTGGPGAAGEQHGGLLAVTVDAMTGALVTGPAVGQDLAPSRP